MDDNKLKLKENPTLADLQEYVAKMKTARGFNTTDKPYECMLFAEECGELIFAIRKNMSQGSIGSGSIPGNVKLELADVLIYLCSLANMHGISLEDAFRKKEEINKQRTWKKL